MAFKPTKAQEAAINNRGALLVSAAAGSGKTAVLVERVVQCVLDEHHPVDIDRMLVVTFTNAAAGEMRERIRQRLAKEYQKDPTNLRLLRQQVLLQKANICTIDSFCKNLITEHFAALSLSPDFKLISANSLAIVKKNAMDETLNWFFQTKGETFSQLAKAVGADRDVKNLQEAMEGIYSYLRSLPFPKLWTDKVRQQYRDFTTVEQSVWGQALLARARRILSRGIHSLQGAVATIAGDPKVEEKRGGLLKAALSQMETALAAADAGHWDAVVAAIRQIDPINFKGAVLKGDYDPEMKNLTVSAQGVVAGVRESLQKMFFMSAEECKAQCRQLTPMIDLLLDAVWEYSDRIEEKKKEMNSLDFSDVEYAALELLVELKDGKPVPTAYGQQLWQNYDYVLVDEYQDVNNLQSEIFNAISHGGENMFTVGDVKQSIYRFRKANPRNFLRLLNQYPPYDGACSPGKLVLDGNFRSRPGICETVNLFFGMVMSEYAGELDYDETHQLVPLGRFPESQQPAVEITFFEADEERSDGETEADCIAAHIKKAMETPCVTDGETLRCARPGDCVILMRSLKDKAETYVNRLREHGIPAVAEQSGRFFERQEILRIVSVLQAIDNPTDDVALLACMMSPLFGFSANEVAAVRGRQKKIPLYVSLENAAKAGNEKAARFIDTLQALRVYGATVSTARLLTEIYDSYGYLSAVQVMENGAQCRQNLLALQELAKECADNGFDRIDGFIRYINKLKDEKVDVGGAASAAADAVRVMSVHHSKGLQFPICFVAGCGNRFNRSDAAAPIMLDEGLGLGLTLTDDQKQMRTATCMRLAVAEENRRAEQSEELRVLYVAMTRAVDRLILTASLSNPEKNISDSAADLLSGISPRGKLDPELVLSAGSYRHLLLYFALLHPAGNVLRMYANTQQGFLQASDNTCTVSLLRGKDIAPPKPKEEQILLFPVDEALYEQIRRSLTYQNPYAPLQSLFSKRSVSQLVHGTAPTVQRRMPRPSFMQEGGLSAAEKGTALHAFMQYADYTQAAKDPGKEIHRLAHRGFITRKQAECIDETKVRRFFGSNLYARMAASPNVMREHRFMTAIPVTQLDETLPKAFLEEKVVVQGITDCVFEEEGALVVVDYKTDQVKTPEELTARYAKQLQLYAQMLTETLELPVKELLLYSFALDAVVPVPL